MPLPPLNFRLNLFGITGAATSQFGLVSYLLRAASISLESRVLRRESCCLFRHAGQPPQSLWNHGCCDNSCGATTPARSPASISLESRVLRPLASTPRLPRRRPPQSLWNHGCCDREFADDAEERLRRLNLFGITGAATDCERDASRHAQPPQSLWNHGCCDASDASVACAGATASISLESRVLRLEDCLTKLQFWNPPQSLWNHGCCDPKSLPIDASASGRLNLFGITGAATESPDCPSGSNSPPQSLWNHGCCDVDTDGL